MVDADENSHLGSPALELCEIYGFFKANVVRSYSWNSSEGTKAVKGHKWGTGHCFAPCRVALAPPRSTSATEFNPV